MKDKGILWWREKYFSICSRHAFDKDDNCSACKSGFWQNVWKWKAGQIVFRISPRLWVWWMN